MPENEVVEEVGPTCLYKDGESVTFEGEDVAKAVAEGWADSPNGPSSNSAPPVPNKPKTETVATAAPEPATSAR